MNIHPATLEFLNAIREKNSRAYFASIRPLYDDIVSNLHDFIRAVWKEISLIDPRYEQLDVKKCFFRIYRDARMIKDGDYLYKYNRGVVIHPDGKKTKYPAPYLHLSPNQSFFWGGIYWTEAYELYNIRSYLTTYGDEYYNLIQKKEFLARFGSIEWDSLISLPRGRSGDIKYPELVKRKQRLLSHHYTDEEIISNSFFENIIEDYKISKQWLDFLAKWLQYDKRENNL